MDPISALVTCWAVAYLVGRLPEALAEAEWARRGQQSPKAEARAKRLADAGIDPAAGGPMRQYVGNVWRDIWLDLDEQRQARRDARDPRDPSKPAWRQQVRDRMDDAVREQVGRWRQPVDDESPAGRGGSAGGSRDGNPPDGVDPTDSEPQPDRTDQDPRSDHGEPDAPQFETVDEPGEPDPTEPPHEPIRGTLERVDPQPTPQPLALEGEPMSLPVRAGAVTGVISGAAEARAIQKAVQAASDQYIAAMANIRNRIVSLGEQTLSQVQMALRSHVVQLTQQAAEAAAAAQADAKRCGAEVVPVLGQVAKAFERLNS